MGKLSASIGEGFKKIKKSFMENSILGGGVSEGHFPYPIFLIFFAPNGLKINLDIGVFFMYMGVPPWGSSSPP